MQPKGLLRRLRRLFKFLVIILPVFLVVFLVRSNFWRVEKVGCHLNGNLCPPNLWAELANITLGKNIFTLSSNKLSEKIKKSHPEFFEVKISKQFPQGLLAEIEVRRAVVAIGKEDGEVFLADKDGVLLKKVQQSFELPLVIIADEIKQEIGEQIKNEIVLKEIQILSESKLRLLEPKSAQTVSEGVIEVWFKDGLQVLFSTNKEIKEQLDSLQYIYERTKIEGKKPKRIDLRFDKPVIE